MASGGMAGPGFPKAEAMNETAVLEPPTTRKSQIIEEEEDMEEEAIEEVDAFSGQGDHADVQDSPISPVGIVGPAYDAMVETDEPALEPPPDLDTSPIRPPRSSSLRKSRPDTETSDSAEPGDQGELSNASPKSASSRK